MKKSFIFFIYATLFLLTGLTAQVREPDELLKAQNLLEEKFKTRISGLLSSVYGDEHKLSVEVIIFPLVKPLDVEKRETYKINTAVFIDGSWSLVRNEKNRFIQDHEGNRQRTCLLINENELDRLEEAIKILIGFDEFRGDRVQVASIPFDRTAEFRAADTEWRNRTQRSSRFFSILFFLFFLAVGTIVYRVIVKDIEYRRKLREDEMEREFILKAGENQRSRRSTRLF